MTDSASNPMCDCTKGCTVVTQSSSMLNFANQDGERTLMQVVTELRWCVPCDGMRSIETWVQRQSIENVSGKPFEVAVYRSGEAAA